MKNSISGVWLFGIVIVFILIFAAYIAITVNYTASFKMKNTIISIIEKNNGMNKLGDTCGDATLTKTSVNSVITGETVYTVPAMETIAMYLLGNAYNALGACPDDGNTWYGVKDLEWDGSTVSYSYEEARSGTKYNYCFSKYGANIQTRYTTNYYRVRLFYKFELPVLSEFLAIKVEGTTDEIYDACDSFTSSGDYYSSSAYA